jgi:hypothetical protein
MRKFLTEMFEGALLVLILAAEQTFVWTREERRKQLESDQKPTDTEDSTDHQPSEDDVAAMNIHAPKDDEIRPWTEEELAALDKDIEYNGDWFSSPGRIHCGRNECS